MTNNELKYTLIGGNFLAIAILVATGLGLHKQAQEDEDINSKRAYISCLDKSRSSLERQLHQQQAQKLQQSDLEQILEKCR